MAHVMADIRKITPLLMCGVFACAGAQADDYRFELGASFDRALFDGDVSDDAADIFSIGGIFYLNPVPTDGVPLAEAAFLHRSSFVAAQIARVDVGDEDFDLLGASFGYYIPNTIFYGRIGVTKADDDIGDADDTNVNGTFGVTPIDGLLVTTDIDEDGWDPNATARYVGKLGNDHYYASSISVVDPDEGDLDIGLSFDYYLDHTFSIGGGYGSGSDTFSVRAEKFFMPNFAVGGRIYTDDNGDGIGAFIKWRM
jgi:hypothetical protein